MKNLYNDAEFKKDKFRHLLPRVVEMVVSMVHRIILLGNTEVVTEVIDIFRFIVDKYADEEILMADGLLVNQHIIQFFDHVWTHVFSKVKLTDEEVHVGEETLVL